MVHIFMLKQSLDIVEQKMHKFDLFKDEFDQIVEI